jgi:hypothetical protein
MDNKIKRHKQKRGSSPAGSHHSTPDDARPSSGKKHPISKGDVEQSNDEHIDQDFPGFPHAPSREEVIRHQKTE